MSRRRKELGPAPAAGRPLELRPQRATRPDRRPYGVVDIGSNSVRLVEVAEREGTPARLIQRAAELDWAFLEGVRTLGLTAGASAPELLVRELVDRLAERYDVTEREVETKRETVSFKLPRGLEVAA